MSIINCDFLNSLWNSKSTNIKYLQWSSSISFANIFFLKNKKQKFADFIQHFEDFQIYKKSNFVRSNFFTSKTTVPIGTYTFPWNWRVLYWKNIFIHERLLLELVFLMKFLLSQNLIIQHKFKTDEWERFSKVLTLLYV